MIYTTPRARLERWVWPPGLLRDRHFEHDPWIQGLWACCGAEHLFGGGRDGAVAKGFEREDGERLLAVVRLQGEEREGLMQSVRGRLSAVGLKESGVTGSLWLPSGEMSAHLDLDANLLDAEEEERDEELGRDSGPVVPGVAERPGRVVNTQWVVGDFGGWRARAPEAAVGEQWRGLRRPGSAEPPRAARRAPRRHSS